MTVVTRLTALCGGPAAAQKNFAPASNSLATAASPPTSRRKRGLHKSTIRNPQSAIPPALRVPRSAFTLVEMLIAMTLTLILITAIAEFYAIVGDSVKDGRAMIELSGQLRAAVQRLQNDLDQLTVTVAPWTDDGAASGYFEYYEGRGNDFDADGDGTIDATNDGTLIDSGITTAIGDGDDFLAFTIRSPSQPLTGRSTNPSNNQTSIVSSQFAEVIWWVGYDDRDGDGRWDADEPRMLYRRQLLILPYYSVNNDQTLYTGTLQGAKDFLMQFWQKNDISVSIRYSNVNNNYFVRANSLSGLARREQRFAHEPFLPGSGNLDSTFPHAQRLLANPDGTYLGANYAASSQRVIAGTQPTYCLHDATAGGSPGEDVVLSNLLAFDVRIYDPYARVWPNDPGNIDTSIAPLVPGDPGYPPSGTLNASNLLGLGAYVDLYYYRYATTARTIDQAMYNANNAYLMPHFADAPAVPSSPIPNTNTYLNNIGATYDTWALGYERDGLAQNQGGLIDEGTDGFDNNNRNGVDDAAERETVPPYGQTPRGIQVRIRVYEPTTRQVRQATVATDFVTE